MLPASIIVALPLTKWLLRQWHNFRISGRNFNTSQYMLGCMMAMKPSKPQWLKIIQGYFYLCYSPLQVRWRTFLYVALTEESRRRETVALCFHVSLICCFLYPCVDVCAFDGAIVFQTSIWWSWSNHLPVWVEKCFHLQVVVRTLVQGLRQFKLQWKPNSIVSMQFY